jgi:hypothetical protein
MPQRENNDEREATTEVDIGLGHQAETAPTPCEGVTTEASASTNEIAGAIVAPRATSANHAEQQSSSDAQEVKEMFVIQSWHRPYAEALLEADPARLSGMIAVAELTMLARWLELSISPVTTDEGLDLRHAADALSQLKRSNIGGGKAQHYVA